MYANVIIEYPLKTLDKYFLYKIPDDLVNSLKIGMQVKVPFGKQTIKGFVLNIVANIPSVDYEIKEIIAIINPEIILNDELIQLGKFIEESTLCPLISAYQAMLPAALKLKKTTNNYHKYNTYIELNTDKNLVNDYIKNNPRSIKQLEIIKYLQNNQNVLKSTLNCSALKILINNKIVKENKEEVYRLNKDNTTLIKNKLTSEQQDVFNNIKANLNTLNTYLLYGVTGSGKTEVYFNLIDEVLKQNKTALVLIPEISLTTQIINRFYKRFNNIVAIFHSGLSIGEKHDEYLKVVREEAKIVVGTRSAIFSPLKNLGIVIIDEEHSSTYHQENIPRYNAIEVAKWRAKFHNIPLILGSATPSLESMARAQKNVYKLVTLNNRAQDVELPKCNIIDLTKEIEKNNLVLSSSLLEAIAKCLVNKEQTILLLNRRGYSTVITCSNCGFTYKCPNCDITLTYHKSSNHLRCHYCGYTTFKSEKCPECKEESLTFLGTGTEKLVTLLQQEFPTARIVRMDTDTTTKKDSYQKIIDDFAAFKYDILVGTQMISKGLDFPLVTLVGVINADSSLNIPDFRSNERTFELLTQVAGRAGRSEKKGEVIIQTFNPDNKIIDFVKNNEYLNFYKYEMAIRKTLKYPPYYFLISLKVSSKEYDIASKEANQITKILKNNLSKETIVLGPTTANIFKINNIYNFQILIKYRFDNQINKVLKEIDNMYALNKKISLSILFDPIHF